MKKLNVTFGLMLLMLVLGASSSKAYAISGSIPLKMNVTPSPYFAGVHNDSIMIYNYSEDHVMGPWKLYSGTYSADYHINHAKYDNVSSLGYIFKLYMNYGTDGRVVVPVIKRTIVSGGISIIDYLVADEVFYKPADNKAGIAIYTYKENYCPLVNKYVISSVTYDILVNEEFGEGDYPKDDDSGATATEPVVGRSVVVNSNGLETLPSATAGIHYVASRSDFVFTVKSDKAITVSTDRLQTKFPDASLVKVADNGDGTYEVTIKSIIQSIVVTVTATGTESTVNNAGVAKDAVWASNGTLFVKAATPGVIAVYNVTGQLCKKVLVSGDATFTLAKGLYIVQLNGKAYKVVL